MTSQRAFIGKVFLLGGCIITFVFILYIKLSDLQDYKKHIEVLVQQVKEQTISENTYKLPPLAKSEDIVVIYNRVPKTGSTSFVNVAYDLCKKNHFRVLHINVTGNIHVLSMKNQMRFVHNVTEWDAMKPALYHGHMAFIDFEKYGISKPPLYINIIRKPLDRLVSYYYFLRYGDNFRPYLSRRKHGNTVTFDECISQNLPDCSYDNMWLQVPFFCGHAAECWQTGSEWALDEAKRNLVRNYLVVGVTEEMEDFIKLMEVLLPRMFKGALQHYLSSPLLIFRNADWPLEKCERIITGSFGNEISHKPGNKSHLRETTQKIQPSPSTVMKVQKSKVWAMEQDFYDFAFQQFKFSLKKLGASAPQEKEQVFFYEKIRPK